MSLQALLPSAIAQLLEDDMVGDEDLLHTLRIAEQQLSSRLKKRATPLCALNILPEGILLDSFAFLDQKSLMLVDLTCRKFHTVAMQTGKETCSNAISLLWSWKCDLSLHNRAEFLAARFTSASLDEFERALSHDDLSFLHIGSADEALSFNCLRQDPAFMFALALSRRAKRLPYDDEDAIRMVERAAELLCMFINAIGGNAAITRTLIPQFVALLQSPFDHVKAQAVNTISTICLYESLDSQLINAGALRPLVALISVAACRAHATSAIRGLCDRNSQLDIVLAGAVEPLVAVLLDEACMQDATFAGSYYPPLHCSVLSLSLTSPLPTTAPLPWHLGTSHEPNICRRARRSRDRQGTAALHQGWG
jgi:hypothetical protein